MARPATDVRLRILAAARAAFEADGFDATSLRAIARGARTTIGMIYYYFPTKDDLLSAMLQEHLERVIAGIDDALAAPGTPKDRMAALVVAYTQKSAQSRRRHMVAMQDVKYLPKPKQTPLLALQRTVTNRVAGLLRELNPGLPDAVYKPYTMMLLGMLNWSDIWYRPGGEMKPQELCERMTRLWTVWQAQPGRRTLVFCCNVEHARFVTSWLRERGVRARAVHSKPDSYDRETALRELADGQLDALCTVDLFNEGVDVPTVDRVVLLRPTVVRVVTTVDGVVGDLAQVDLASGEAALVSVPGSLAVRS